MIDFSLLRHIEKLDIPQIEKLRDRYKESHPREASYVYLCNMAISNKTEKADKNDFMEMLREIEKESALDSAPTLPQGNETR